MFRQEVGAPLYPPALYISDAAQNALTRKVWLPYAELLEARGFLGADESHADPDESDDESDAESNDESDAESDADPDAYESDADPDDADDSNDESDTGSDTESESDADPMRC